MAGESMSTKKVVHNESSTPGMLYCDGRRVSQIDPKTERYLPYGEIGQPLSKDRFELCSVCFMSIKEEVSERPCKSRLNIDRGIFSCDLGWGHEGQHKHTSTGMEWNVFPQHCGHPWCDSTCSITAEQMIKRMEHARALANAVLRPATLVVSFGVTKGQVVEAIAKALLPFIKEE